MKTDDGAVVQLRWAYGKGEDITLYEVSWTSRRQHIGNVFETDKLSQYG
jgi:hypothetical protein